jgi:hypothetical protein
MTLSALRLSECSTKLQILELEQCLCCCFVCREHCMTRVPLAEHVLPSAVLPQALLMLFRTCSAVSGVDLKLFLNVLAEEIHSFPESFLRIGRGRFILVSLLLGLVLTYSTLVNFC